jgi:hypothetical protein
MISPIRPYVNVALTPMQLMEGERFCMPDLSRPRRRFVRDFSLDELLGVIPAPPLNTPVKVAAKAEGVNATAEDINNMAEMTAALDGGLCLGKDSGKSGGLEKSVSDQARAMRSMSPVPTRRHQQLPNAA